MSATITATNTASVTDTLFKKLDTKQKGYIDEADLKAAAGEDSAAASKSAEVFKQLDSDGNGKVTKSELSAAVEKVGSQLDPQMAQSRVKMRAAAQRLVKAPKDMPAEAAQLLSRAAAAIRRPLLNM